MKTQKTAILIFAQSAQKEAANKSFKNAKQVFTQLNNHTVSIVKKSKLPYFRVTEEEQTGITFGERLTNAIQSIYDKGYDNVITIGNDTPHLQTHHILDAAKKLESHKLILGPSKDGGFYLIGLHKTQFNPTQFLQLPWQTTTLSENIFNRFSEEHQVILLDILTDIDTVFDIDTVLKKALQITNKALKQALTSIAILVSPFVTSTHLFITTFIDQRLFNKGSPFSLCLMPIKA